MATCDFDKQVVIISDNMHVCHARVNYLYALSNQIIDQSIELYV